MQHRVFGHFHGQSNVFVLSLTGFEKDGIYTPSNYLLLAEEHKRICDDSLFDRTRECYYLDVHRREDAGAGPNAAIYFNTLRSPV